MNASMDPVKQYGNVTPDPFDANVQCWKNAMVRFGFVEDIRVNILLVYSCIAVPLCVKFLEYI